MAFLIKNAAQTRPSSQKRAAQATPSPIPFFAGGALAGAGLVVLVLVLLIGGLVMLLGNDKSGGCIGLVSVNGEIVTQDSPDSLLASGQAGSETISQAIEKANNRSDVKALVLVVDSPGGSVVASHEIYDALREVKKPKVAYFREMAASGGYYVAMGTDYIVADPDTLTGSIGVRASFLDLSGLLFKLGVNETSVQSGEVKDIGSPFRPMTDNEKALMMALINETFMEFRNVVLAGRGSRLDKTAFEHVLDARVLSGRQAKAIGMVDELGTKKRAVEKAGQMAGEKEELPVCELDARPRGIISQLLSQALAPLFPQWQAAGWRLQF